MTFVSILYIILSVLGLSFLIFIHELGHYFIARRLGMRVETFSIGFGKPIASWMRDGVRWQIGWLIFGGYVKIVGMEVSDEKDLYEVKDGFFGKKPLDRIKVAAAGPVVNIVFALLAFTLLWAIGGREKNFSEFTHKIGWIDPKSEIYLKGIRPGDEITSYNGQPYQGSKDHISAPMTSGGDIAVLGNRVDLATRAKTPFTYKIKPYSHPGAIDKDVLTTGILQPASYLIYGPQATGSENALPEGSPMVGSGIQSGDRIVWVDGEPIFSLQQLSHLLNDARALLTIQRKDAVFLRRVPRVRVEELKLDREVKEELIDWQFEAELNGSKIQKLYYIPYNLNNECVVESPIKFIDKEKEEEASPSHPFSPLESPLEKGDRILAVDGEPVELSYQLFSDLQQRHVNLVVERSSSTSSVPSSQKADALFEEEYQWENLQNIVSHLGMPSAPASSGNLILLHRVIPKMRKEFTLTPEGRARLEDEMQAMAHEIENIDDPEKRTQARHQFELINSQLLLGLPSVQDQKVQYNPNPLSLFKKVFEEIWHTLKALLTGSLNPKWMSGPIGIVQVVHDNSMVSIKEALYWLGAISLNLGVLNLLPLPVLDGGTICFSLYELITGRRIKTKTLEKLIIPFALLLIGFFIFLTYHDLARIFGNWLHW